MRPTPRSAFGSAPFRLLHDRGEARPESLIGDRAYNSDPLDEQLRRHSIEMIAPHRSNRSKPATQQGRLFKRLRAVMAGRAFIAWKRLQPTMRHRSHTLGAQHSEQPYRSRLDLMRLAVESDHNQEVFGITRLRARMRLSWKSQCTGPALRVEDRNADHRDDRRMSASCPKTHPRSLQELSSRRRQQTPKALAEA